MQNHLFFARHKYSPFCSIDDCEIVSEETTLLPVIKIASTSPSNTTGYPFLNHVMDGVGLPVLEHLRVTLLPSGTRTVGVGERVIAGGEPV